jgi:hypothetical protein
MNQNAGRKEQGPTKRITLHAGPQRAHLLWAGRDAHDGDVVKGRKRTGIEVSEAGAKRPTTNAASHDPAQLPRSFFPGAPR